jgi:hypothetical protein
MGIDISNNRPGGTIDSWCGKCKLVLAHTIEAMVGNKPARVHCNTCKAQHSYKPQQPGKSGSQPAKPRMNRYKALLNAHETPAAKHYSPQETYEAGDVLQHPSFGLGVATAVKEGSKIEVLFEAGSKLLIHGR